MLDKTLYTDFSRQVQSIHSEIYNTNQSLSHDTRKINQQISYIMEVLERRNKDIERQMKELKDRIYKLSLY